MSRFVLMVEECPRRAQVFACLLRLYDFQPILARDLAKARQALEGRRWDLILLNLYSHQANVLTRLTEAKGLAGWTPMAVVTLTDTASADQMTFALNHARRGAAQLLLAAPFRVIDVANAVERIAAILPRPIPTAALTHLID